MGCHVYSCQRTLTHAMHAFAQRWHTNQRKMCNTYWKANSHPMVGCGRSIWVNVLQHAKCHATYVNCKTPLTDGDSLCDALWCPATRCYGPRCQAIATGFWTGPKPSCDGLHATMLYKTTKDASHDGPFFHITTHHSSGVTEAKVI